MLCEAKNMNKIWTGTQIMKQMKFVITDSVIKDQPFMEWQQVYFQRMSYKDAAVNECFLFY